MKTPNNTKTTHLYPLTILFIILLCYGKQGWAQTPNDPKYSQQTYLNTINIQDAWSITTGSSNVKIGVLSTGGVYASHEDLTNKVSIKTARIGTTNRPIGTVGAGIIAAETNNNKGIAGINWNAPVLSYDIGGTYQTESSTTFYGIDQTVIDDDINAAVSDGADILFMPFKIIPTSYIPDIKIGEFGLYPSFTRPDWTDFVFTVYENLVSIFEADQYHFTKAMTAMKNAYTAGRTIVAPMDDYNGVTYGIPNRLSRDHLVISVGSTELNGSNPYRYSSLGLSNSSAEKTDIDLVAPGVNVYTTLTGSSDDYGQQTSTTSAAAQVTGLTSLLKSADANLTPNDIREILRRTAVDIGAPGYDTKTGFGRVDAKAAFDYWQERTFTRGVTTQAEKISSTKIDDNKPITLIHGPWGNLSSGSYYADIYEVKFKIDIPSFHYSDIWFRAENTLGWDKSNPNRQRHHAFVEEINQAQGYAILKTYVYGDIYQVGTGELGWGPADLNNVQIAYTIASKPITQNTDEYFVQDATISSTQTMDELYIDDNVNLTIASYVTLNSDAQVFAGASSNLSVDGGSLTANSANFTLDTDAEIAVTNSGSIDATDTDFRTIDGSTDPADRWKHIKLLTSGNTFTDCTFEGGQKALYVSASGNTVEGGVFLNNPTGVYVNSGSLHLKGTNMAGSADHAAKVRGTGTLYIDDRGTSGFDPAEIYSNGNGITIMDYGEALVRHTWMKNNSYNVSVTGNGQLHAGLYEWSPNQGYNQFQWAGYKDVSSTSSATAYARYNWWGSAQEPPSTRFSGDVSVLYPLSCDPTNNGTHCDPLDPGGGDGSCDDPCISQANINERLLAIGGEVSQTEKVKKIIERVYDYISKHPDDPENDKYVRFIHMLLTLYDEDGSIRNWAGFSSRVQNWLVHYMSTSGDLGNVSSYLGQQNGNNAVSSPMPSQLSNITELGKTSMDLQLRDALRSKEYEKVLMLSADFNSFLTDKKSRVVLLTAKAVAWEQMKQFGKALAAYKKIEKIDLNAGKSADYVSPDYSQIKQELADSMKARSQSEFLPLSKKAKRSSQDIRETPESFEVGAAYPNPFNPQTTIPFDVPNTSNVKMEVYNMLGRKVGVLTDREYAAGLYTVRLSGNNLASGVYFIRTSMNGRLFNQKVTLIK